MPEELAALDKELQRRIERRIDPGRTAMTVSIGMVALIVSLVLPWTGGAAGWQILSGEETFGVLPRLFTFTSLGFGLVGSAIALAAQRFALAWVCAVGCGFSVVHGIWAIWSRQTAVFEGGTGPGFGMVLAVLAMVVLAASWVRIAIRRD
ncbi:Rv2732c family membrane protein [Pseudonocardia sp. TRM90224]|uniref:Rv2732c family membrane protein n=1 Tax=Pseudonocardia sp. TRM90224 TaxID=2812678 RepID=UPI001E5C58AD|nr:hypothetical protein [Pseudonocardia sp. TRM90224]